MSSRAVAKLCAQSQGAGAGGGDDDDGAGGGHAAPQDLPCPVLGQWCFAGPPRLESRTGAGFGSLPCPSCAPPPVLPPSTRRGCAWLLGAVGAQARVPAQGGVMLMLLPSPRRSRCRSLAILSGPRPR